MTSLSVIQIYKISNTINNKVYIGQTKVGIFKRLNQHSKSDSLIGRAIRKYGIDNFCIEEIDSTYDSDIANELENKHIIQNNCVTPNGYNCNEYGRLCGNISSYEYSFIFFTAEKYCEIKEEGILKESYWKYICSIIDCANNKLELKKNQNYFIETWNDLWKTIGIKDIKTQQKVKKFLLEKELIIKKNEKLILNSKFFKRYS